MAMTPNFRVDRKAGYTPNIGNFDMPVAWFVDIDDADTFVQTMATDPLNTKFEYAIIDLAVTGEDR